MSTTSHAPDGYRCPFCALLAGDPGDAPIASDIVGGSELALAFVAPRWYPRNRGHVLVIPRAHHENLYAIPELDLGAVSSLVRRVATAMRETYGCDGISMRQHNEPAGGQDVWHLHVHVFPRYHGDALYRSSALPAFADPAERATFANQLRAHPVLHYPGAR